MVFEILGLGDIGDKSKALSNDENLLRELGFFVPDASIFTLSMIDDALRHNGLGNTAEEVAFSPDLEGRLNSMTLPSSINDGLELLNTRFRGLPLAVRSDGVGESRGHGTYKTVFVSNRYASLKKAFIDVLSSYFTQEAFSFRESSGTPQRFGMQFMPIIGQSWKRYGSLIPFAPLMSGVAYTSDQDENTNVKLELGLSGAVCSRNPLKITSRDIERTLTFGGRARFTRVLQRIPDRPPWAESISFYTKKPGLAWLHRKGDLMTGIFSAAELSQSSTLIGQSVSYMDLKILFDRLEGLERQKGGPQYLEFALTTDFEGYTQRFHVTQISPLPYHIGTIEFIEDKDALVYGECLVGCQKSPFSRLVYCNEETQIPDLAEFNRHNKGYVLLYSNKISSQGNFTQRHARGLPDLYLHYSDCSNALGFIEEQNGKFVNDPEDHVLNRADMTQKFFGIVDPEIELGKVFLGRGLNIMEGDYLALASRRENRFQIIQQDKKE